MGYDVTSKAPQGKLKPPWVPAPFWSAGIGQSLGLRHRSRCDFDYDPRRSLRVTQFTTCSLHRRDRRWRKNLDCVANSGVLLAENLQRQPQPSSTHPHSQSQSHFARLSLAQVAFIAKSSGSSRRFLGSDTKYRHINSIFQTQH